MHPHVHELVPHKALAVRTLFVCVCSHVEARSPYPASSLIALHLIFLKQGLSMNLGLADLVRWAGQQAPGSLWSLLPQCWDLQMHPAELTFMWCWGLNNRTVQQALPN